MFGRIYRLIGGDKFYIGSTIQTLARRLSKHKSRSKEKDRKNSNLYKYFTEIGWENVTIELIEEIEIKTRKDLFELECKYIRDSLIDEKCLNINRPVRTIEERKEQDRQIGKRIRSERPDHERERVAEWRRKNPEKYRAQVQRFLEKQKNTKYENQLLKKKWRRENPEKYAEEKRKTAEKNKERALGKKIIH
jgi:hypothetical protein